MPFPSPMHESEKSSVAPDPAESRGAPPPPQDPSPLRGTLGSSRRSPAEGEARGVRPRLEGKPRTPLSCRVATGISWSPLRGVVWARESTAPAQGNQSLRDEALFLCAKPSGVPRGTANSTASLTSQRHPGKVPQVPGRSRGKRGFPAATPCPTRCDPVDRISYLQILSLVFLYPSPPKCHWRVGGGEDSQSAHHNS